GAPLLERAGALQVLALQPDRHARDLRERRCEEARRQAQPRREATAGGGDVSEAEDRDGFGFHGTENREKKKDLRGWLRASGEGWFCWRSLFNQPRAALIPEESS